MAIFMSKYEQINSGLASLSPLVSRPSFMELHHNIKLILQDQQLLNCVKMGFLNCSFQMSFQQVTYGPKICT